MNPSRPPQATRGPSLWVKRRKLLLFGAILGLLALAIYTAFALNSGMERTDQLAIRVAELETTALTPADLPDGWLDDLLKVEDPAFFDHPGIDLASPGAGITTLTQGLVKVHYFDDFQPGLAKYKQSVLALLLDRRMSKDDQLVLYLNTARLGHVEGRGVSGFEEAARTYFSKPFHELTHDEFLALVAMLVGPNHFHVMRHPERNLERVERIRALLDGQCAAKGLMDVYFERCAPR